MPTLVLALYDEKQEKEILPYDPDKDEIVLMTYFYTNSQPLENNEVCTCFLLCSCVCSYVCQLNMYCSTVGQKPVSAWRWFCMEVRVRCLLRHSCAKAN